MDYPRDFRWIPFLGLMNGSLQVDALAFLEKFFLYGALIFLLGNAVGRRWAATVFVTLLLLATSWAETYLPGRSGEITDALTLLSRKNISAYEVGSWGDADEVW